MPTQPFTFGIDSRPGKYGPAGGSRIINGYAEEAPKGSPVPVHIFCRPGLRTFATLAGQGGYRGGIEVGNFGYVIVGRTLHQVDSGGGVVDSWGFAGDAPVWMARNRNSQIALASEGERFLLSGGNLTNIADADLGSAIAVIQQGGFFVWLLPDGRFQINTEVDQGEDYDAADFATAESNPDGLVGGAAMGQQIMLAGPKSIEFWANTGAADFPYERVQNVALELGCAAGHSIKSLNGVPIFVASDNTVRMLDGYTPQRISNHDVERAIEGLADKSVLRAATFSLEGHQFYALSSPSFTWVCDLLTKLWFEWPSYGIARWLAEGFLEIGGKRIMGHYSEPKLLEFTPEANTDADLHLIWKLVSLPFGQFPARVIVDEVYANLLPGKGLNSTDEHAANPEAMLRVSDDDGISWSDQMTAEVGRIGETRAVTSFTGLGASSEDGMRFELSMSAPVARAWTGSAVRFTPLKP